MLTKFFDLLKQDKNLIDAENKSAQGLTKLKEKKEIKIGNHMIKIDRKIAEGGYADVYRVNDCQGFQ
jgi:hypothetical protein